MPENWLFYTGAALAFGSIAFIAALIGKAFAISRGNYKLFVKVLNKGEQTKKDTLKLLGSIPNFPVRTINNLCARISLEDFENWRRVQVEEETRCFIYVSTRIWDVLRIITLLNWMPVLGDTIEEEIVRCAESCDLDLWLSKKQIKPYHVDHYIWKTFFNLAVSMDDLYHLQLKLNESKVETRS